MAKKKIVTGAFTNTNKPVTNWKKIQGKWYYFNKDGNRLSNTIFDGYVFNKDGVMAENGWNFINGKWYFSNSSGKFLKTNGKKSTILGITLT